MSKYKHSAVLGSIVSLVKMKLKNTSLGHDSSESDIFR